MCIRDSDQMVDVLSFEGWLEPNEMSLRSAILEPGIPAGEHRGELQLSLIHI